MDRTNVEIQLRIFDPTNYEELSIMKNYSSFVFRFAFCRYFGKAMTVSDGRLMIDTDSECRSHNITWKPGKAQQDFETFY
jgi:hypothetical protein